MPSRNLASVASYLLFVALFEVSVCAAPETPQKDVRLIRASSAGAILFDQASRTRNGKETGGNIYLRAPGSPGFAMMAVKARCSEGRLAATGSAFISEDGKTAENEVLQG